MHWSHSSMRARSKAWVMVIVYCPERPMKTGRSFRENLLWLRRSVSYYFPELMPRLAGLFCWHTSSTKYFTTLSDLISQIVSVLPYDWILYLTYLLNNDAYQEVLFQKDMKKETELLRAKLDKLQVRDLIDSNPFNILFMVKPVSLSIWKIINPLIQVS